MSKAPRKNWRQSVVEELVKHIEAGTAPWQKPWDADLIRDRPHNPVSGIAYKGINTLWLEMQPFDDPRWMTYRQALGQDAQVRKGEKGTQVEYWKWQERKPKLNEAGRPVTDDKGNTVYETYRLERPKVFYATVFNAEQIDGLEPYKAPELTFEPVKEAEKVLTSGGVPILHDQLDRAFYAINLDEIHLPPQTAFNGQYDYYATALHELGHATGHKDRLAREFGVFGSETYAREELRAEMASYMISKELGLGHYPERHAAYVGSWLKAIEDDPLVLFRAARDAEAIRTWVMEPEKRLSLELAHKKEQEQTKELEKQEEQRMEAGSKETAKKRIYLDVPYEEKEDAKKLGARWDRKAKSWFVREGADMEAVSKWMPKEGPEKSHAPQLSPQEEFAEALEARGLKLKGAPQMDGKWHRVQVEGDRKGQLSGSYRGFLDGRPAGQIMNYKTGEKAVQWVATGSKLAPEELARAKEQAEVRRKEIEAERAQNQKQAEKIAKAVYACAPEASAAHAYCKAKGIRHVEGLRLVPDEVSEEAAALGVKVAQDKRHAMHLRQTEPDTTVLTKGDLIVPMRYGGGPLLNLQTISPEGTKRFLKGGRKEGCMHIVGNPEKTGPVLIGEGLSTCESLHGATGHNVVVAFDAGNLEKVACMIRDLAPLKRIAIAADDDHSKQHNAGLEGAKRAASAAFTSLLVPPLTEEEKAKGFTDFNDIKQARGEKALADYVEKELKLPNVKRSLTERVTSKAREVFELGV